MSNGNVLFWPRSHTQSNTFTVKDRPVRVIGNINAGDQVKVWRVYDGTSDECKTDKIPPIPVMCCDTCSQLALWAEEYADCPTGLLVQTEIIIKSTGVYFLEYCCNIPDVIPPDQCGVVSASYDNVTFILDAYFESSGVAVDDSANPEDFSLIDPSNEQTYFGQSITYNVNDEPGHVQITFLADDVSESLLFHYNPQTGVVLTWDTGCITPSFEIMTNLDPEVNVYNDDPLVCSETPDGVYVWYRTELIDGSECL